MPVEWVGRKRVVQVRCASDLGNHHMPVLAVLNPKGGSGKSTLATSIAAWCAHNGWRVMLGDVDRQQSTRGWLQRRDRRAAAIVTWAVDTGTVLRAPRGTSHVILDTPGALYGFDLAKLIARLDAIVVPVGPSYFDRETSVRFFNELRKHPRVAGGHCKLVAVGMRWSAARMGSWLQADRHWDIPLLTVIPEDERYRLYLDAGSSYFDEVQDLNDPDLQSWLPLLNWLQHIWLAPQVQTAFPASLGMTNALLGDLIPSAVRYVDGSQRSTPHASSLEGAALSSGYLKPSGVLGASASTPSGADLTVPAFLRRGRPDGKAPTFLETLTGPNAQTGIPVVPQPEVVDRPFVWPLASAPQRQSAAAKPKTWLSRCTDWF